MAKSRERNNDDDPSFVVAISPFTIKEYDLGSVDEGDAPSTTFPYDTSNSTEEEQDDDFLIYETKLIMHNGILLLSTTFPNQGIPPTDPLSSSSRTTTSPEQKHSGSWLWWWYQRPPFQVTAMYLWTQFNVSYLLRKISFLLDTHYPNHNHDFSVADNQLQQQHPYFHLMTIHYVESGVVDIVIMNLIVILFISTSYVYRSSRPFSLLLRKPIMTNTTPTKTGQKSLLNRRRQYRTKDYLLEIVTLVTFLLLILRLRGAAINIILVSIIYMFLHLTHWLLQYQLSSSSSSSSSPSPSPSPVRAPSSLLFPYKL
jgi:hypothetical protein